MLAVIIKHASSISPAIPFSGIVMVRAGISCSTTSGDPAAEMQCSSVPFQISSSHSDGGRADKKIGTGKKPGQEDKLLGKGIATDTVREEVVFEDHYMESFLSRNG